MMFTAHSLTPPDFDTGLSLPVLLLFLHPLLLSYFSIITDGREGSLTHNSARTLENLLRAADFLKSPEHFDVSPVSASQ